MNIYTYSEKDLECTIQEVSIDPYRLHCEKAVTKKPSHANHGIKPVSRVNSEGNYDHQQNSSFKYPSINAETQVRLLRVKKMKHGSALGIKRSVECSLESFSFEDLEQTGFHYGALSYFWGRATAEDDVHRIRVDGQDFYIRDNLWNFFICAAKRHKDQLLFIDAICVNQNDKSERSHQIQRMKEVYENADCVYTWLGQPSPNQSKNVKALHRLLQPTHKMPIEWLNVEDEAMSGLDTLMARPYWKRLWILQELLLAKDVKVLCGKWSFDWDELAKLLKDVPESKLYPRTKLDWWDATTFKIPETSTLRQNAEDHLSGRWQQALRVFTHRNNWRRQIDAGLSPALPLYKAVEYFSEQECLNRRDKIYALLGLLRKSERDRITPNYSDAVEKIYAHALAVGLLCLQEDIEREALRRGYYPKEEYDLFAASLRSVLILDSRTVSHRTCEAFADPDFYLHFVTNCKVVLGASWSDFQTDEAGRTMKQAFWLLTGGQVPSDIVFSYAMRCWRTEVSPLSMAYQHSFDYCKPLIATAMQQTQLFRPSFVK